MSIIGMGNLWFNYQDPTNYPYVKKIHFGQYVVNYSGLYKPCNANGQPERFYPQAGDYQVTHLVIALEDNYPNGDNDFADVILVIAVYKYIPNGKIMVICDGILGKGDQFKRVWYWANNQWNEKLVIDQKFHNADPNYRMLISGCKQLLYDELLPDTTWTPCPCPKE
jgi:hypothetical protein